MKSFILKENIAVSLLSLKQMEKVQADKYDFIIVGGGIAGTTCANRVNHLRYSLRISIIKPFSDKAM